MLTLQSCGGIQLEHPCHSQLQFFGHRVQFLMSGLIAQYKYHVHSQISETMEVVTSYWNEENEAWTTKAPIQDFLESTMFWP